MSKIESIFNPRGNLGGVNFYMRDGQLYARKVTSMDGQRIKTDPAFQRTREINQEFAGIAKCSKAARFGLNSTMITIGDSKVTTRMNSVVRKVLYNGEGPKGQRSIDLVANKSYLVGFEWDVQDQVAQIFPYTCEMTSNADRTEVTLIIPPFHPMNGVAYPPNATFMRFLNLISVCPNFYYNQSQREYEPQYPELVGAHALGTSNYLPLNQEVDKPITVKAKLSLKNPLPADVVVIGSLGLQFYDQDNSDYVEFKTGSCMKIQSTF